MDLPLFMLSPHSDTEKAFKMHQKLSEVPVNENSFLNTGAYSHRIRNNF
jgi:hypothetical protein